MNHSSRHLDISPDEDKLLTDKRIDEMRAWLQRTNHDGSPRTQIGTADHAWATFAGYSRGVKYRQAIRLLRTVGRGDCVRFLP